MKVCIESNEDGTYMVSKESEMSEAKEGEQMPQQSGQETMGQKTSGYSQLEGAQVKFGGNLPERTSPVQKNPQFSSGQSQQQPQESQGQAAQSLEEALKIVIRMFQSQPGGMKASPFDKGFNEGMGQ